MMEPMPENDKVKRIREMKETLQRHYELFKTLREEGRAEEALKQFNVTLQAASKLMEVSTGVLKELAEQQKPQAEQMQEDGKVLHFPRSQQTH